MNNFRRYCTVFILCVFLIEILCPVVATARTRSRDIDKQEKKKISQIESYYNKGKENLVEGNFLAAIVNFNHVIELEKDFYIVYTPYAKEYIQQAEGEIREKESINLDFDIEKKPKEKEIVISDKAETTVSEAEASPKIYEYTISEADILYISVWEEESLSQEVIVRPDGKISFPLAGDIPVAGLTFTQLKEELTKKLKDYVKHPVVSITLRKLGGKKVIVLGEVGSAGVYSVTGKCTVLEAIGRAGGFTPHAVPSSTILIRGGLQNPEGTRLNLTRTIDKADISQNVVLQAEDVIYVPKKFIANVNYTLSQILGPLSQGVYTASTAHNW